MENFSQFPALKQNFLTCFIQDPRVTVCAAKVERSPQVIYRWIKRDPEFARIVKTIQDKKKTASLDKDEHSMMARARLEALFALNCLVPIAVDNLRKILEYLGDADMDKINQKTLSSILKAIEDVFHYTGVDKPPDNKTKRSLDSLIDKMKQKQIK